jgi:ADP-heptose:LPS heptosyltransferase
VLIVQVRRIGDVLLDTPALRAIATRFPEAKIDFIAESPSDEGMWGNPRIDRLLLAPRGSGVRDFLKFVSKIREHRYDWTIDFLSNPRSAQFAFCSGATVRVGLDRRGRRWAYTHRIIEEAADRDLYAVDLRLKALEIMGVPPAGRELEIYADTIDTVERDRVDAAVALLPKGAPVVALSTGTPNPGKLYPPDLTAEVIAGLRRAGFSVIVTAGPGETPLAEDALKLVKDPPPLLRGARVPTLAALYRHVDLYVGPDSSPKHVAVACGLPTVTIFGLARVANWNDSDNPRNVVVTAPGGIPEGIDEAEFVRRGYLRTISPQVVVQAAKDVLGK